jgi:hypothetical protein
MKTGNLSVSHCTVQITLYELHVLACPKPFINGVILNTFMFHKNVTTHDEHSVVFTIKSRKRE